MKTRRFYFLISLITLLGMGQGHLKASNNEETITLKFVETSDVHGCYFPYDFIQNKQMRGSLARVSSYVKEEREVYGDNLILMDNGDILQGQPVAYYYNYMDTTGRRTLCHERSQCPESFDALRFLRADDEQRLLPQRI